jgi:hypothetical protein
MDISKRTQTNPNQRLKPSRFFPRWTPKTAQLPSYHEPSPPRNHWLILRGQKRRLLMQNNHNFLKHLLHMAEK